MKYQYILAAVFFSFIALASSGAMAIEPGEKAYEVGVSDVLEIRVLDHPELRTISTVSSDGSITFPYIGVTQVKGMTLADIEAEITRLLTAGYLKYPTVTVSIVKTMSRRFFIYGEANRRGEFEFEDNMTVMTALSIAGGVSPEGFYGEITLKRKKEDSSEYEDIYLGSKDMIEKTGNGEIYLQPGDIIVVGRNDTFFIHGEVSRPGEYSLTKNMNVVRAISLAAGLREDGLYGEVVLRRAIKGTEDFRDIKVDMKSMLDGSAEDYIQLQPDDILIVNRNKTFYVNGEVSRPGQHVLQEGTTVMRALSLAGGVREDGLFGKMKVRRRQSDGNGFTDIMINLKGSEGDANGDMLLQANDMFIVERNDTFFMHGEVRKPGQHILQKKMSVEQAIAMAGGISPDGLYGKIFLRRALQGSDEYVEFEIDLDKNDASKQDGDMLVEPDDIIRVDHNDLFSVFGEVNRPGEFVLRKNMTVLNALSTAGGLNKWGSSNRVKVLRSKDELESSIITIDVESIIKGDTTANIKLLPGDTLIVEPGLF